MKGRYEIIVQNRNLHYRLEVKRNITIIQGDSATGKTTLIDMVRSYYNLGEGSGIQLSCPAPCRVLEGRDWKTTIEGAAGCVFFSDEENAFVHTKEFASAVKNSDNYHVIITRENLYELPYSVDEIYGFKSTGRYRNTKKIYQEMYNIYPAEAEYLISPETLVTEDTNSGYQFFNRIAEECGKKCIGAGGNSKIAGLIRDNSDETLVIADGAAFGAYMNTLSSLIKTKKNIHLYLPESFEWIILKSGIIDGNRVQEILDSTEDYADSTEFFSWEQYYTHLLTEETKDSYLRYIKDTLNEVYLHPENMKRIMSVMKGIEFDEV